MILKMMAGVAIILSAHADRIALLGNETYPESVDYQPSTGSLFVGGAGDGSVQEIHSDGRVDYFQNPGQDGRTETYGVKIDDDRGRLWLVDGRCVYIYEISTKALLKKISRTDVGPATDSFLNDIAIDKSGNAYITDSRDPHLLRVSSDFETKLIPLNIPFGNQNNIKYNLNGIVFSPDYSFLYSVKTNDGSLWKIPIDLNMVAEQVPLTEPVIHGDGLAWGPTGDLVVLRNYENKVSSIELISMNTIKTVKDILITDIETPTSAVYLKKEKQLVVVNSQFANSVPTVPFSLTRIGF